MEEKKLISKEGDNGKWGYVDENENWVIEPKFEEANDFSGGEAEVLENNTYNILLQDGTFKKMSRMEKYILSCREIQNWGPGGWSFLEASCKDKKWTFDSWSRIMEDNEEWYEACYDGIYGSYEIVRYYDEVEHNTKFAEWADSLNLSTSEEVGALLWANAQQLIESIEDQLEEEMITALGILILLYNQLENIKSLGMIDLRKTLDLPKVKEDYINPDKVKEMAVNICSKLVDDNEESFEHLDFTELLEYSRKAGSHEHISTYDFEILEDEEDE